MIPTRPACFGALAAIALSGCGYDITRDRNPEISDMQLNALKIGRASCRERVYCEV